MPKVSKNRYQFQVEDYNLSQDFSIGFPFATHGPDIAGMMNIKHYTSSGNLQGWWRLNTDVIAENKAPDSSGHGRDGGNDATVPLPLRTVSRPTSLTGRPIQQTACGFLYPGDYYPSGGGRAVDLSTSATGADWEDIFTTSEAISISMWIQPFDPLTGAGSFGRILALGDSPSTTLEGSHGYDIRIGEAASNSATDTGQCFTILTKYSVSPPGYSAYNYAKWFTPGNTALRDKWVHLVVTHDLSGAYDPLIYVDGKLVDTQVSNHDTTPRDPGGTWLGIANEDAAIGSAAYLGSGSTSCNANMADMAVWNSVLTAEEVTAIYTMSQALGKRHTMSGYLNNPAKVLLADLDNRAGAYPPVGLSRGAIGTSTEAHSQTSLWKTDTTPFDDTRSINFEDPFARSTVVFSKLPADARFIRLIDAEGSIETFEFQRGVLLRDKSIAVNLRGRTKSLYRQRKAEIVKKIRNAHRGSKYRKIDSQKLRARIWAEFSADRFAQAVNAFTGSLKIRARAEDNNVYLTQQIPGVAGNTTVYVSPPDASVTLPEAYTVVPFTGGIEMNILYPLGIQPQYQHLIYRKNIALADPNFLTASNLDFPQLSSAIFAPGVARKGIADASFKYANPVIAEEEAFSPFIDSQIYLDEDDEFFNEGVSETLVQGFDSPLRDKVIIVIDIDPVETTQFGFTGDPATPYTISDQTSGIYTDRPVPIMVYYNFADKKWESLRGITPDVSAGITSDPQLQQFETVVGTYPIGFSRGVELNCDGLQSACRPISTYGFPYHPRFHATGSQTLKMSDYIGAPFVFEKYVLEFSGSYSNGGQYGYVSNMFTVDSSRSGDDANAYNAQIDNGEAWGEDPSADPNGSTGGTGDDWNPYYADKVPRAAINSFFILRQASKANLNFEDTVEVIGTGNYGVPLAGEAINFTVTGSIPGNYPITPGEPNKLTEVSTIRDLVTYGQWVCYNGGPSGSFLPQVPYTNITGALEQGLSRELNTEDMGANSSWVSHEQTGWPYLGTRKYSYTQPSPTGSFIMKGKVKKPIALSGSFGTRYGYWGNPRIQLNPRHPGNRYGLEGELGDPRSLVRGVPGQRIIGTVQDMDYSRGASSSGLRGSFNTRGVNVFEFEDTSPYVLLPEDELVLGWQPPMPFGMNRVQSGMGGSSTGAQNDNGYGPPGDDYSGPNMGLHPGKGKLTLYGSLIRDNKEKLPTLHQDLTSNAIHEVIGNDPVFDQFDAEPSPEFYGTFANELVTGSMRVKDLGQGTRGARGVARTFTGGTMNVSGSLRRMMQHVDTLERYYDTMVGNPLEYQAITNPSIGEDIYNVNYYTWKHVLCLAPGGTSPDGRTDYYEARSLNTRWGFAFPFEGFYDGKVDRLVGWERFDKIFEVTDPNTVDIPPGIPASVSFVTYDAGAQLRTTPVEGFPAGYPRQNVMLTDPDGNKSTRPREVNKLWFGIGDSISGSCDFHGGFDAFGSGPRQYAAKFYPTVRGWKYGVMNAFEVRSTAMYRRGRYGQFRDMLEQRLDGRFFNMKDDRKETGRVKGLRKAAVQIKFVDADTGDTTLPDLTHCQNLSAFATSSLPYFDGEMRDRTTDPDENSDFVVTN